MHMGKAKLAFLGLEMDLWLMALWLFPIQDTNPLDYTLAAHLAHRLCNMSTKYQHCESSRLSEVGQLEQGPRHQGVHPLHDVPLFHHCHQW